MDRKAVVVGATGLVGDYVVRELLVQKEYSQVMVLDRRPLEITHPKPGSGAREIDGPNCSRTSERCTYLSE